MIEIYFRYTAKVLLVGSKNFITLSQQITLRKIDTPVIIACVLTQIF